MDGGQHNYNTSVYHRGSGRGVSGGGMSRRGRSGGRVRGGTGRRAHADGKETPKSKNKKWVRGNEVDDSENMNVEEEQMNGVFPHTNGLHAEQNGVVNGFGAFGRPNSRVAANPFASAVPFSTSAFGNPPTGPTFLGASSTTMPTFGQPPSSAFAISAFKPSAGPHLNVNSPAFVPKGSFGTSASTSAFGAPPAIASTSTPPPMTASRSHRSYRKVGQGAPIHRKPRPEPEPPKNIPPYRIPQKIQREIEQGKYNVDDQFPGNRFLELKALRPSMRTHSIKYKLISDPEHRTDLTGAITVVGTCMDMCPEYERHEREFQKDVDDWEKIPGSNPKRIDHTKAVKKYRRSAAGNDEPLESDLRPPQVLKRTLDYLFHDLMATHGMEATYSFIRDRTRAVRTDFTIQHSDGPIAIECFERIARFHILAVHMFCDREDMKSRGFDYRQEVEQMLKTLQSLMQFYDDNAGKYTSPNEAEFRAYYTLAHIRSTSALHRLQSLPSDIFLSPILQTALEFRSSAQRNTHATATGRLAMTSRKFKNSEACLNAFTRFFKRVRDPGTSYLMACLVEYHFGDVRKGAVRALWKAYNRGYKGLSVGDFAELVGLVEKSAGEAEMQDVLATAEEVARVFGIRIEVTEHGEKLLLVNKNSNLDHQAWLTRHHETIVENKRTYVQDVAIVDGEFESAAETWTSQEGVTNTAETSGRPSVSLDQGQRAPTFVSNWPKTAQAPQPAVFPSISPTQPQNAFQHPLAFNLPSSSFFWPRPEAQVQQPTFVGFPSTMPVQPSAFEKPSSTLSTFPTFPPPSASVPTASAAPISSFFTNVRRDEPLFTPEARTPAPPTPPTLPNVLESPTAPAITATSQLPEVNSGPPGPSPPAPCQPAETPSKARTPTPPPIREPTPPPVPTREEILAQLHRAVLEQRRKAKVLSDEWHNRSLLRWSFGLWKNNVIKSGLERERKDKFRVSVKEMGLEGSGMTMSARRYEGQEEEDLVDWENASIASGSISMSVSVNGVGRRRSRGGKGKERKRMDDDETLKAIKEAESMRLRLWQRGTFLSSIRRHLEAYMSANASSHDPPGWEVWLFTSSEDASSREWVRLKFGVEGKFAERLEEEDGGMVIDRMITNDKDKARFGPGLVVLDLAASDNEATVISKLHSIISSLPSNRHYLPSILVLSWSDPFPDAVTSALDTMQRDEVINSWSCLAFSNDGTYFDDQFIKVLHDMRLDIIGKLVERVTLDELFQMFVVPWESALNEWLANCQMFSGIEYWTLYADVLKILIGLLNDLAKEVLKVCQVSKNIPQLPPFDGSRIMDDQTSFEAFTAYLDQSWLSTEPGAVLLRTELHSGVAAGQKFYRQAVPERLARIILSQLKLIIPRDGVFYLNISETPPNLLSFTDAVIAALKPLQRVRPARQPPPKRRAGEALERSASASWSRAPENGFKRRKQEATEDDDEIMIIESPSTPIVNGRHNVAVDDQKPREDALSRLRASVVKARRSVEDLRLMRRETERRSCSLEDDASWTSTRESTPIKQFPRAAWNSSMPVTLFDPKRDINFNLIPHERMDVVRARPISDLYPQFSPGAVRSDFYSTNFLSNENGTSSSEPPNGLKASAMRSLPEIPHFLESQAPTKLTAWTKLKESVDRAKKAVEQARLERQARTGGSG